MPAFASRLATARAWVDPASLPAYLDAANIAGNVPLHIKQLTLNTLGAYGVGTPDSFAYAVGRRIRILDINRHTDGDRAQVVAVAEIQACKGQSPPPVLRTHPCSQPVLTEMLNGAGTVHGGCLSYLVDNCAAFPLVVIGLIKDGNGVGVTQAMNVFFHAPAAIDTCLRITSTSVTFGGRIMTSRCEIADKHSGRLIASAFLSKMQPTSPPPARL
ncbi:HotDog domain-containing protein [Trametes gibbosa]|nr:HotDog domain-containing protein [Trametes gibbosa]